MKYCWKTSAFQTIQASSVKPRARHKKPQPSLITVTEKSKSKFTPVWKEHKIVLSTIYQEGAEVEERYSDEMKQPNKGKTWQ